MRVGTDRGHPSRKQSLDVLPHLMPAVEWDPLASGLIQRAHLLEAIARGIDLFDCVMPTRNGRNAMAFTDAGSMRLRNLVLADDPRPLEPGCPCPACQHSRGYLRHLFMAREMLGPILLSIHNLTYYQRLLAEARQAIAADEFEQFRERKLAGWRAGSDAAA